MFFPQRATQAEYFDAPDRSLKELALGYRQLDRVNRWFRLSDAYKDRMAQWLGGDRVTQLNILDLGAGNGSLGAELKEWAARRGWHWEVTQLDYNPSALRLDPSPRKVAASVLRLPFADESFDVVIASQMTHHLDGDAEVQMHFAEAWRVARRGIYLGDMRRSPTLYGMLWCLLFPPLFQPCFRADGLLSVRRGWLLAEWIRLAKEAGIPDAEVQFLHRVRIFLTARKSG